MEKVRLLKTQQDIDEFLFWIATLQSDVLPQGYDRLEDKHGGYCCLAVGVACTVPEEDIKRIDTTNHMFGSLPVDQGAPEWLCKISENYKSRKGRAVVCLNDIDKLSHPEIADLLLKEYEDELTIII